MDVRIEEGWKKELKEEFEKPYFEALTNAVKQEYSDPRIHLYPPAGKILSAFDNSCH